MQHVNYHQMIYIYINNKNAKFVLKNIINEDENPDFVIRQSDQNLLMMNKKTGYGYFIHFD